MNTRGVWALVRSSWITQMQSRSFYWIIALGWMMPVLIYLFVWRAAGDLTAHGLTSGALTAYYLALVVVNQVTYSVANWTLGDLIRDGSLSPLLLRPMPPFFAVLGYDLGGKAMFLILAGPAAALLWGWLRPDFVFQAGDALAFLPALILAWALRFLWGYWLASLAFWATRADALLALQDALVFLLAGQAAPLKLLPPALQQIARWLPFRYMLGYPVEVLTGQLGAGAIGEGLALQIGWLALTLGLCAALWRAGVRRYAAIGG